MIILISFAAKNLPGQAWRPKPNCAEVSHNYSCVCDARRGEAHRHQVGVDGNKLINGSGLDFASHAGLLADPGKPPWIKLVRVREDVGVMADGGRGDFDDNAGRNVLAVGQGKGLVHFALERGSSTRVQSHGLLEEAVELFHGLQGGAGEYAAVLGQDGANFVAQFGEILRIGGKVVEAVAGLVGKTGGGFTTNSDSSNGQGWDAYTLVDVKVVV
jgi:hypothetical protein